MVSISGAAGCEGIAGSVCVGDEVRSRVWLCGDGVVEGEAEDCAKGASLRFFCDEAVLARDCSQLSSL